MYGQIMLIFSGILLICSLAAFVAGRHYGWKQGLTFGQAETPLVLREQALRTGHCPSCGTRTPAVTRGTPIE